MRICIVGCGAVGSLFAANLSQLDDVEVWAYDLAREHVDAINRDGLRLSGAGDVVGRLHATTDAAELPPCEFGIVATKAMHTEAAIQSAAHAFKEGCVATVQNGLGNEELVAAHVERVIRGTTFPAGKVLAPGHVQWDVKGDTTLGPFEPQPAPFDQIERLADACTRAGMPTQAVQDARSPQWRKVIFNATVNGVAALTGLPHDWHFAAEDGVADLGHLVHDLVDEGKRIAAAAGIELHDDPWEMNVLATKRGSAHYPSMLEDIEAQRATEVELIGGALVREAEKHGVDAPLHTALYRLVKAREASYS